MRLPKEARDLLKRPFGDLFKSTREAVDYLLSIEYEWLITVGDVVTTEIIGGGLKPDLAIADFTVERSSAGEDRRKVIEDFPATLVEVENPAGHLTSELMDAIKDAKPSLKIIVRGEEDLATLPAVIFAPIGSVVAYGQPGEGVVLIRVSEEKKREFEGLLELFE